MEKILEGNHGRIFWMNLWWNSCPDYIPAGIFNAILRSFPVKKKTMFEEIPLELSITGRAMKGSMKKSECIPVEYL